MRWIPFLFVVHSLYAGEIITCGNFDRIEEEIHRLDANSLVLFDVDATLIVPNDAILKPKGKALFKELIKGYPDRDLFREIRMKASHSLVDPCSIPFVHELQRRNIPVIAFTAAPAKVRGSVHPGDWRVDELKGYGFDFSPSFPGCTVLELVKHPNEPHLPFYKSGVLYSSLHPKGDILLQFLQRLGWHPNKIIFIDDELDFVRSVVESLDTLEIPCLGIHYTAANAAPCHLDLEQARFQINYFVEHDSWLGDEECKNLFEKMESKD
jgi:uncharacterized protein DUF2608